MTGPLPAEAEATVAEHAEGSPFMASAIVRGLFESGAILHGSDGWRVNQESLEKIRAADDAAQILLQRLQQLPSATLRLLSIAAIIGKEFDVQSVFEVGELEMLPEHLNRARENRLIWAKPDGTYSFVHDKIRETLIERLDETEKPQLHMKLANYLEVSQPERVFELAFHFHRAHQFAKAMPFAIDAASVARQRFALDVAEEQLNIAIAGITHASRETKYQVYSCFADVLMLDGRYEESDDWLKKSVDTAATETEKAHSKYKKGELEFKKGNKATAVEFHEAALMDLGYRIPRIYMPWLIKEVFRQALHTMLPNYFVNVSKTKATDQQRLAWMIFSRLAQGYWFTRDKFTTMWAHLRAFNQAEKYPPTPELAHSYSEHAPAMTLLPWNRRGLDYADRSLKLREEFGDVWGQGQSRNFKSIVFYSDSQYANCVECARRAITILERTGDCWEVNIARYQLAASLYRLGDLNAALREAREIYKSALETGDHQATANIIDVWVRANLFQIPDEVVEREAARDLGDIQTFGQRAVGIGLSHLGKKNYDKAIETFRGAIEKSDKGGVINTYIAPNHAWLATAMRLKFNEQRIHSWQADRKALKRIERVAARAVRVTRKFHNDLPHALRELGAVYVLQGKLRKAESAFKESLEVAKQHGAIYEKALTENLILEFSQELDIQLNIKVAEDAANRLLEIESSIDTKAERTSLSINDQFENLLTAGREISDATTFDEISEACGRSAKRLLRSQKALVVDDWSETSEYDQVVDLSLVKQAVEAGKTITADHETCANSKSHQCEGSYMVSPILTDDKITRVLYVGNDAVSGLFHESEQRILEFLAATTGIAFEKAESFQELEAMNEELEKKVEDRTHIIQKRSEELEKIASELKETQQSLEVAKDTAEQANSAKSDFLARMSHEIRTPISAIIGYTELMLHGKIIGETKIKKLSTIHANSKHLLNLVNNLLDISKIEADQLEVESISMNPTLVVSQVVDTLQSIAIEKTVKLNFQIDGEVPVSIPSDPTRYRQIVTNLVSNAIKFTSEGSVDVVLRWEPGNSTAGDPAKLIFEVIDTGVGMTDQQMQRIFDPFAQADETITRKYGGTGLGLAICKKLAKSLDGDVSVTSQLGQGSTFSFYVSCGEEIGEWTDDQRFREASGKGVLEEWEVPNLKNRRILIVDDAEANRDLLALILRDTEAEILICENGLDAVDLVVDNPDVSAILMDMQMPILDGYSATRQIRAMGIDIPIIALTANTMKNDDNKCFAAGCSEYLSKPIEIPRLYAVLKNLLKGYDLEVSSSSTMEDLDSEINALKIRFMSQLASRMPELTNAIDDKRFVEIAAFGHWLKGTAGMLGANDLSELGDQLDRAGKEYQIETCQELQNKIALSITQETASPGC